MDNSSTNCRFKVGDIVGHPHYNMCIILQNADSLCTIKYALEKQGKLFFKVAEVDANHLLYWEEEGNLDYPSALAKITANESLTEFDGLTFPEIKQLYILKLKAEQAKDSNKLIELSTVYPALFDKQTFLLIEKAYSAEQQVHDYLKTKT